MNGIRTFREDDLPDLVRFLNEETLEIPYTPEFSEALIRRRILRHPSFDPEGLLLFHDGGRVSGIAHVAFHPEPQGANPQGWLGRYWEHGGIVSLFFPEERPDHGDLLIQAAERHAASKGKADMCAFSRKSGYLFWKDLILAGEPLCWDGLLHIQGALERAGYRRCEPTVLMRTEISERPAERRASIELDFRVEEIPEAKIPGMFAGFGTQERSILVRAYHKGEYVGNCGFGRLEESVSRRAGIRIGAFGMGTVEKFQRKGVGTQVLTRAMGIMWDRGIRRVVLQTGDDNLPAVRLYEKIGFVADEGAHSHGFVKG